MTERVGHRHLFRGRLCPRSGDLNSDWRAPSARLKHWWGLFLPPNLTAGKCGSSNQPLVPSSLRTPVKIPCRHLLHSLLMCRLDQLIMQMYILKRKVTLTYSASNFIFLREMDKSDASNFQFVNKLNKIL